MTHTSRLQQRWLAGIVVALVVGLVPGPAGGAGPLHASTGVPRPGPRFASDTLDVATVTGFEAPPHLDLLPRGQLTLAAGWSEPPGAAAESSAPGSGNQTYFGGLGWGATDGLTLMFGIGMNGDPTYANVRGARRDQYHFDVAIGGRFELHDLGWARLGAQVSGEVVSIWNDPGLFNEGDMRDRAIFGAFAFDLPLTFQPGERLRWSLIPSVAVLPDRVLGARYFGTVYRVAARTDLRISDGWTTWGTAELPFGPGESTLRRDGTLDRLATWRAGVRYRGTERVALEATVTNSSEATPATRHLTQLGAPVTLYTLGFRYAPTVPETPDPRSVEPTSPLESLGGVAVRGPRTVPAGRGRVSVVVDSEGAFGLRSAIPFGRRLQFDVLVAKIRGPDVAGVLDLNPERAVADGVQYRFGPQLEVLTQGENTPLSAAGRVTVGRDLEDQQGYLLAEVVLERELTENLALVVDPVVVESGGRDLAAIAFGGRVELGPVILMPESVLSLTNEAPVWTFGVRAPPVGRLSADLFATNAGNMMGLGRLVADPDGSRVGLALHVAL